MLHTTLKHNFVSMVILEIQVHFNDTFSLPYQGNKNCFWTCRFPLALSYVSIRQSNLIQYYFLFFVICFVCILSQNILMQKKENNSISLSPFLGIVLYLVNLFNCFTLIPRHYNLREGMSYNLIIPYYITLSANCKSKESLYCSLGFDTQTSRIPHYSSA